MPFTSRHEVQFGDCDPAGIVYYPSLLHILHVAMEELFARHVEIPYARLISDSNLGFPTVHLDCEFLAPLRHGELLEVATSIPEIGRSSAVFVHEVTVTGPEDRRTRARIKRVAVDMKTLRPVPIPRPLRESFAAIAT